MTPEQLAVCPMCGAAASGRKPLTIRDLDGKSKTLLAEWQCGSFAYPDGSLGETHNCTIAAQAKEIERLKAIIDGYASAFDTQHAEIERLTTRNANSDEYLKEAIELLNSFDGVPHAARVYCDFIDSVESHLGMGEATVEPPAASTTPSPAADTAPTPRTTAASAAPPAPR